MIREIFEKAIKKHGEDIRPLYNLYYLPSIDSKEKEVDFYITTHLHRYLTVSATRNLLMALNSIVKKGYKTDNFEQVYVGQCLFKFVSECTLKGINKAYQEYILCLNHEAVQKFLEKQRMQWSTNSPFGTTIYHFRNLLAELQEIKLNAPYPVRKEGKARSNFLADVLNYEPNYEPSFMIYKNMQRGSRPHHKTSA